MLKLHPFPRLGLDKLIQGCFGGGPIFGTNAGFATKYIVRKCNKVSIRFAYISLLPPILSPIGACVLAWLFHAYAPVRREVHHQMLLVLMRLWFLGRVLRALLLAGALTEALSWPPTLAA